MSEGLRKWTSQLKRREDFHPLCASLFHSHGTGEGRSLYLLNSIPTSSRIPLTDTPRNNVLAAPWASLSSVKLTHKINTPALCKCLISGTDLENLNVALYSRGVGLTPHEHSLHTQTKSKQHMEETFCFNSEQNCTKGTLWRQAAPKVPPGRIQAACAGPGTALLDRKMLQATEVTSKFPVATLENKKETD